MRGISLAAALLAALLAAGARADVGDAEPEPVSPPIGLTLGARAGLALAVGSAQKDLSMSSAVWGALPVVLELGYRFTDRISAGIYFQAGYAGGSVKLCEGLRTQLILSTSTRYTPSAACSVTGGYALRVGLEGLYRLPLPGRTLVPWLGLSVGAEYVSTSVQVKEFGQISNGTYKWDGPEYLGLQGGVEWPLSPGLAVGPYAALTLSRYTSQSLAVSGNGAGVVSGANGRSLPSDERTVHSWLMAGVKGTFDL